MRFINPKSGVDTESLYEILELDKKPKKTICFIGAGGKTTMIFQLAEELALHGKSVIITTSTHMQKPQQNFFEWGTPVEVKKGQYVATGVSCGETKMKGFDLKEYAKLAARADVMLVEADGSRKMPLKVPASHEPVIVEGTDLVVGILGVNSVGKTIEEVGHRPDDIGRVLDKQKSDVVTMEDLVLIGESEQGLHKDVTCDYKILLNQWRDEKVPETDKYDLILCEKRW